MYLLATLRIGLNALRVNKLRSILTMLGIIIGVGAVITMLAVGNGAQARVEEQIKSLGSNIMIMFPGSTVAGGARGGAGSSQSLTEDDAGAIVREVPEVQVAAPSTRGTGQAIFGNSNWSTTFYGVNNDYFEARDAETLGSNSLNAIALRGVICELEQFRTEGNPPITLFDTALNMANYTF